MRFLAVISLALLVLTGCQVADESRRNRQQEYSAEMTRVRPLAEQRDAKAQTRVGVMYEMGWGVTKDHKEAVRWYRKAAEQGHATAQNNLGVMYADGWGVPQDYKEAVRWWRKAAKQGALYAPQHLVSLERQLRRKGNRPPRSRQASKPPSSIDTAPSARKQQKELERLRREIARLKKEK